MKSSILTYRYRTVITVKVSSARRPVVENEARGSRRKRETREKLLSAAFRLFAERGLDAVAVSEITDAADVGFGSFYNHFVSKEAIYDEVFQILFEEFGDVLDRLTADLEDPAEVVAVCVRHTLARAAAEPLWARFLLRESLTPRGLVRGLAVRLQRDLARGVRQKRFVMADLLMGGAAAGGTVLSCIAIQLAAHDSPAEAKRHGADTKQLAERAATTVLRGLGLPAGEATKIARRPLPALDLSVSVLLRS